MGEEEELVLRASIRDELSGPLREIRDELAGVGRTSTTAGRQAGIASRGFGLLSKAGRAAGIAMKVGFAGVLAAGYAGVRLVKSALGEAREAQKVGALTVSVLKSTGAAAWISSKQVGALATAISNKAGIDDEAIQTGANLLLTFKKVRNEVGAGSDVFNRATSDAVDLSAAGFGSIDSAAKMLGKTLNDPVKGITALSRAGVTFSEEQKATIEGLVEHNDLLSAQKIILGEVESQVKGAASAQATWGDKASVLWGNMEERLGTGLLPLLDQVNRWFVQDGGPQLDHYIGLFERRGVPAIREFAQTWLPRLRDGAQEAYDRLKPLAEQVLPAAADVFDRIKETVRWLVPKLTTVFEGFNGLPGWAKTAIIAGSGAAVLGQKLGIWSKLLGGGSSGGGLVSMFTKAKPMPVWVVNSLPGSPNAPGVPGAPTPGKPGTPTPVPTPAEKPSTFLGRLGGWAKTGTAGALGFLKGFGPALLSEGLPALGFGLANAKYENPGHALPVDQYEKDLAQVRALQVQAAKESQETLNQLLVKPLGTIHDVNHQFDILGAQHPRPKVEAPGLSDALTGGDRLVGILGQLDRTTAHPRINVEGVEAALGAISSVATALDGVLGSFGGGSSGGGGGDDSSSGHNWDNLRDPKSQHGGKRGRAHPSARPPERRTSGAGGTSVTIPVHVEHHGGNALDTEALHRDLDGFMRQWLRDQEEAGAL